MQSAWVEASALLGFPLMNTYPGRQQNLHSGHYSTLICVRNYILFNCCYIIGIYLYFIQIVLSHPMLWYRGTTNNLLKATHETVGKPVEWVMRGHYAMNFSFLCILYVITRQHYNSLWLFIWTRTVCSCPTHFAPFPKALALEVLFYLNQCICGRYC